MSLTMEVPHAKSPSLGVLILTLNLALFLPQTINRTPPYVLAGTGGGSMLGDVNISAILDSFSVGYDKRVRPNYGGTYNRSDDVIPRAKRRLFLPNVSARASSSRPRRRVCAPHSCSLPYCGVTKPPKDRPEGGKLVTAPSFSLQLLCPSRGEELTVRFHLPPWTLRTRSTAFRNDFIPNKCQKCAQTFEETAPPRKENCGDV